MKDGHDGASGITQYGRYANYVQRIVVLNHGTLMLDGTPSEVFSHVQELEQVSLAARR